MTFEILDNRQGEWEAGNTKELMSTDPKYNILIEAYPDMLDGIDTLIQKIKIAYRFDNITITEEELADIEKAKDLCELKIIELWNNQDSAEFKALCSTYFDLASEVNVATRDEIAIFEFIKITSFGYLGESWHQVRQFVKSNGEILENIQINDSWNQRLLYTSFKAIIGLIGKDDWKDVNESIALINQLRQEQTQFEAQYLTETKNENKVFCVSELIALYHFAKSVEILGSYILEGRPLEAENEIIYHLNNSTKNANKSENISLVLMIQFFESLSKKLIRNTIWYNTKGITN